MDHTLYRVKQEPQLYIEYGLLGLVLEYFKDWIPQECVQWKPDAGSFISCICFMLHDFTHCDASAFFPTDSLSMLSDCVIWIVATNRLTHRLRICGVLVLNLIRGTSYWRFYSVSLDKYNCVTLNIGWPNKDKQGQRACGITRRGRVLIRLWCGSLREGDHVQFTGLDRNM